MTAQEQCPELRALAVLVGGHGEVRSTWSASLEPGREALEIEFGSSADVITEILERLLLGPSLRTWREHILGQRASPRPQTLFDLEGHVQISAARHELGAKPTHALLASARAHLVGRPLVLDDILGESRMTPLSRIEAALEVASALRSEDLSAVLVDATGATLSPARVEGLALPLLRITGALPNLGVTFALTPETWEAYTRWAGHGYARTVLEQALTCLEPSDPILGTPATYLPGEAVSTLRDLLARAPKPAPSLDEVLGLVPAWQRAIGARDEIFRSLAELVLFTYLEKWPQTSGLFAPNVSAEFRFGPTAAEVDLLSERLGIAIEVDGAYFHLPQDEDLRKRAYRRDRAKDWCYQKAGLTVLRFLAEDIPSEIGLIRTRIVEAVKLKKPATKSRRRRGP